MVGDVVGVQAAGAHAAVHGRVVEAERAEPAAVDDAILLGGEFGEANILGVSAQTP